MNSKNSSGVKWTLISASFVSLSKGDEKRGGGASPEEMILCM
jgi:hypothetical protein